MVGLVPAIHVFPRVGRVQAWMLATRASMTLRNQVLFMGSGLKYSAPAPDGHGV